MKVYLNLFPFATVEEIKSKVEQFAKKTAYLQIEEDSFVLEKLYPRNLTYPSHWEQLLSTESIEKSSLKQLDMSLIASMGVITGPLSGLTLQHI